MQWTAVGNEGLYGQVAIRMLPCSNAEAELGYVRIRKSSLSIVSMLSIFADKNTQLCRWTKGRLFKISWLRRSAMSWLPVTPMTLLLQIDYGPTNASELLIHKLI